MERLSLAQANEHADRMLEDVARRSKVKMSGHAKRPIPEEWNEDMDDRDVAISAKVAAAAPPLPQGNEERVKIIVEHLRKVCDDVHIYTTEEERALFRRAGSRGQLERTISVAPTPTVVSSVIIAMVLGLVAGTVLRYMVEGDFRGTRRPSNRMAGMSRLMSTFTG